MNVLLNVLTQFNHSWVDVEKSISASKEVADEAIVRVIFVVESAVSLVGGYSSSFSLTDAVLKGISSVKANCESLWQGRTLTLVVDLPEQAITEFEVTIRNLISNVEKWVSVLPPIQGFESQARLVASELLNEGEETPNRFKVVERMGYSWSDLPGAYENAVGDAIRDMILEE